MTRQSHKDRRNTRRRKERIRSILIWGGLGLGVVAIVAILLWQVIRPAVGESFSILGREHIGETQPLAEDLSDPPTSGDHYGSSLPAGFYQESDLGRLAANPEGYLIHNLEHGYSIFWYNCDLLDEAGCDELKGEVQGVMNAFDGQKLIAFPWPSIDVPLVMTSWGQMQEFETFSVADASRFIRTNRNRSPEPNAP